MNGPMGHFERDGIVSKRATQVDIAEIWNYLSDLCAEPTRNQSPERNGTKMVLTFGRMNRVDNLDD